MDLLMMLQDRKGQLSQAEQRIADILFSDFDFAVNASIIELAKRVEVSPPTVTRFCRRLGCQSFSDFKVRLAKTAYVGARYLNPEARAASSVEVAEDIVTKAQSALFSFHRSLDMARVEEAAERLANAPMIYAFGSGGNSSMIANEIQNRLFRLGLRITASTDHGMQLMLAAAAQPEDVLVGSSFSGRNAELVRAFRLAQDGGVFTIAFAQSESPIAKAADLAIPVDLPEGTNIYRPTSTRFAYLALVDILANIVAYRIRDEAAVTLRRIKKELVTHRDEDDRQLLGD
ncbi:MurR/RpiR family transcriptional regulator [Chelativorans salis]|uniref:MurR/RpiR family transcriptional regulator n=1 Tax=Chelativorans salis TaxID=2978478 RepID=A0ABT2LM54_9HYPH|nr:MurR/RpiR family transcriptional regulator [Chelativorans sp. EGI FJ00035]MCT7374463.1 MurR/RpiR family transcriptional regulator [Chelativorans sp. EGI FJ00035]